MIHATPEPADIGLLRTAGPVSRLIRFGQWLNGDGFSAYGHAFLVLPDGQLIEAQPSGAAIGSLTRYERARVTYVCPTDLTAQQRLDICTAALRYIGVPYGFLDYAAIAAHRLHLPVPGLRRCIASSRQQICSQLVDQCYKDAGVDLFTDGRWSGYVTPGALYRILGRDGLT
ncbi:hypothetical protein ACFXPT_38835 [Streptomyces goshikiensis]|uniref:hypothetical protein n=1 Tax=Streptomyces goshikiensis TaxID=1942 RepID=UPI00367FDBEA